jgi:hypothetical protein
MSATYSCGVTPASTRKPALITSARIGKTLDTDARRVRYLWTMAVRVLCFLAATLTPLPWNLLLLVAAAVLPTIAVMLANAIDQRRLPEPEPAEAELPALPAGETIGGEVEE